MPTKPSKVDTEQYIFLTKNSTGDTVVQGPFVGLKTAQEGALGWYTDEDVFEIFKLTSVGLWSSRIKTTFIKHR